jgi:hypothetical protein
MGRLTTEKESELIAATRTLLEQQSERHLGYRQYLDAWKEQLPFLPEST